MTHWIADLYTKDPVGLIQAMIYAVQSGLLLLSLWAVVRSNRLLAKSQRASTLQQMVAEMNQLRQFRADHPQLERALFETRKLWDDERIQKHIMAVQLANILEWAYLARRDNLLERDVWESWAETWRAVILRSEPLQQLFTPEVWTFGRERYMAAILQELVLSKRKISDPRLDKARVRRTLSGVKSQLWEGFHKLSSRLSRADHAQK